MKSVEDVRNQLNESIPASAVSKREAFRGKYLDYLEGWYVIDRLNKILGQGNWSYNTNLISLFETQGKEYWETGYRAVVTLQVMLPDNTTASFEDVGYGDGKDKNRTKAHESGGKEAVTDGLKRCAKNLGMSMGLALYDKTKEFVGEVEAAEIKSAKATADETLSNTPLQDGQHVPRARATVTEPQLRELIQKTAKIIIRQERLSKEQIQAGLKEKFGVEKTELLAADRLPEVRQWLESVLTG